MKKVFVLLIFIFCIICLSIIAFVWDSTDKKKDNVIKQEVQNIEIENKPKVVEEEQVIQGMPYRLTSYWNGDGCGSGSCTGSGLCEQDFQINENGWYIYMDMIVLASATTYLLNYGYSQRDNIIYRKYFDTVKIIINDIEYEGIILDSCGACMGNNIIDLFVSNPEAGFVSNEVIVR